MQPQDTGLIKYRSSLHDQIGDTWWRGVSVLHLGRAHHFVGRPEVTLRYATEAIALLRESGDLTRAGHGHIGAAEALSRLGRTAEAARSIADGARLYQEAGNLAGAAWAEQSLGELLSREPGEQARALERIDAARDLHRQAGSGFGVARSWLLSAKLRARLGEHTSAIAGYRRAVTLFAEQRQYFLQATALAGLGEALAAMPAPAARDEARATWREALDLIDGDDRAAAAPLRERLRALLR